jgi:prepilin-type N-terminal cleavage/methylation domain-containing protein
MKNQQCKGSEGYTLVELMIVIAIIGVLVSIATPNFLKSRQRAYGSACLTNRRNIEAAEIAHLASNNMPSLHIDERYSCPVGGIYIWLATDPEDPEYPEIACSVHYAGSAALPDQPSDSPPDSPLGDTDDSVDPPPQEADEPVNSPVDALEALIVAVETLGLKGKGKDGEDQIIKKLEDALKEIGKGKISQAEKKLTDFKKQVEKNKKIDPNDKSTLLGMADDIKI